MARMWRIEPELPMQQVTWPLDGREYRAEVEQIEMSSYGPQPDPDWRYVDESGHEHDAKRQLLVEVQDDPDEPPFYTDEDGEEYNAPTHLECRLCGEHIEPALIGPSPFRQFVPGPARFYRDGVEITEAEFRAAMEVMEGYRSAMKAAMEAEEDAPPCPRCGKPMHRVPGPAAPGDPASVWGHDCGPT